MVAVRIIVWIARVAGLGTLTFGLLFWIAQIDFISVHMLFGLTLALSLLVLSLIMLFTKGMRLLGVVGIVYAFILPVFGFTQATLLVGSMHWLIQTTHLLVGLGALALVQLMNVRYMRLKRTSATAAVPQATAPQVVR